MGIYGIDGGHNVDGRRVCHSERYTEPTFERYPKEEKIKKLEEKLADWEYKKRGAAKGSARYFNSERCCELAIKSIKKEIKELQVQ